MWSLFCFPCYFYIILLLNWGLKCGPLLRSKIGNEFVSTRCCVDSFSVTTLGSDSGSQKRGPLSNYKEIIFNDFAIVASYLFRSSFLGQILVLKTRTTFQSKKKGHIQWFRNCWRTSFVTYFRAGKRPAYWGHLVGGVRRILMMGGWRWWWWLVVVLAGGWW